jgi:hypothetical protein
VGVRGDKATPALCLFDCNRQFGIGVLLGARRNALRHDRAGRQDLYEVCTVLEVGSHGVAHLIHAVGKIAHDGNVDVDRELSRVAGTASGGHIVAGHLEPRARHRSLVDCVAQIDIDVRPGRPHVTACGEARQQRRSRVDCPVDRRTARGRREKSRFPIGAHLVGEMSVKVDESWQHGGAAEVDDTVRLQLLRWSDPFNLVAANQDRTVLDWRPAATIDDL